MLCDLSAIDFDGDDGLERDAHGSETVSLFVDRPRLLEEFVVLLLVIVEDFAVVDVDGLGAMVVVRVDADEIAASGGVGHENAFQTFNPSVVGVDRAGFLFFTSAFFVEFLVVDVRTSEAVERGDFDHLVDVDSKFQKSSLVLLGLVEGRALLRGDDLDGFVGAFEDGEGFFLDHVRSFEEGGTYCCLHSKYKKFHGRSKPTILKKIQKFLRLTEFQRKIGTF